ncbi:MAG: carbohydrate ABC transporter permease [Oscillospiraceae bacterium]|nr:carbohydrate ABC transporter permease [Oscillospiraceae bacterium]
MRVKKNFGYFLSRIILIALVAMTFFPFVMMINMSLKKTLDVKLHFLAWPAPNEIYWKNFEKAFDFVFHPIVNSLIVCGISLVLILIMVSMTGYAFGRLKFAGKNLFFLMVLAVMMIPYTMLLVPNYTIIRNMDLLNTKWSLIIPYIAGQQMFGIVLSKTFFESLPQEMFEAAKIDGASEFQSYTRIALPLSVPTLITVGVTCTISMYNDYIWPALVLTKGDKIKTFCQIVFNNAAGKGTSDYGMTTAAFIIGTLPLLIITLSCLKYYLAGMLDGAVKG